MTGDTPEQYLIRRLDVEGERYVRLTDLIGFLLRTADQNDGGDAGDVLRRASTNLSALLTLPDLEPRE